MTLKIAILSRTVGAYSTQRLKDACRRRGHAARVLNTMSFSLLVETGKPALFYRDKQLSRYDAVIPRIGASVSSYGTAIVRQFEQMGIFTLNSAQAIGASRDKLRALQVLARHEIGVPPTAFVRDRAGIRAAVEQVGGAPVIIKLIEGSQGAGVILADTVKGAEAILETLLLSRQSAVVQKFVSESRGRDLRAFVVGDRVVAAMQRRAAPDEYRSNVHRGGRTANARLGPELERTAIRAAQILGLHVAGVDLIESKTGPLVLEVNSSPGLEGIESATGVEIAEEIVAHLEKQVLFPDLDVRQRLTVSSGYGVVELLVAAGSDLCGRALSEVRLRDRDVQVLSVERAAQVLPNPRGEFVVQDGDRLLCFGRYETLR
ncbi:MAG TPA: RimK family alpha-L-glutamate ligase, partial [Polyangiaceae bacterium]